MITLDFPELMTAENWREAVIPGVVDVGLRQPPLFYLTWTYDGVEVELLVDVEARTISLDEATPAERVTLLEAVLTGFKQPPAWAALYYRIRDTAQSAVGVRLDQLTAGQRNALVAVMLWDRKAIANDGTIRPLGQWVKRRLE